MNKLDEIIRKTRELKQSVAGLKRLTDKGYTQLDIVTDTINAIKDDIYKDLLNYLKSDD